MFDWRNLASPWLGRFWAATIGLVIAAAAADIAQGQTLVNCPTETSKTVQHSGGGNIIASFQLGDGDSCYCTTPLPATPPSIMPDELTHRVEAQQALDFLHQFGTVSSFGIEIWQTRADISFPQWMNEKLIAPALLESDRVVDVQSQSGEFSVVQTAFCYSLAQLQALHGASKANAQTVVNLFDFIR